LPRLKAFNNIFGVELCCLSAISFSLILSQLGLMQGFANFAKTAVSSCGCSRLGDGKWVEEKFMTASTLLRGTEGQLS